MGGRDERDTFWKRERERGERETFKRESQKIESKRKERENRKKDRERGGRRKRENRERKREEAEGEKYWLTLSVFKHWSLTHYILYLNYLYPVFIVIMIPCHYDYFHSSFYSSLSLSFSLFILSLSFSFSLIQFFPSSLYCVSSLLPFFLPLFLICMFIQSAPSFNQLR